MRLWDSALPGLGIASDLPLTILRAYFISDLIHVLPRSMLPIICGLILETTFLKFVKPVVQQ